MESLLRARGTCKCSPTQTFASQHCRPGALSVRIDLQVQLPVVPQAGYSAGNLRKPVATSPKHVCFLSSQIDKPHWSNSGSRDKLGCCIQESKSCKVAERLFFCKRGTLAPTQRVCKRTLCCASFSDVSENVKNKADKEIRASLESVLTSLDELSTSIQNIASSLNNTLTKFDSRILSGTREDLEAQFIQQTIPRNNYGDLEQPPPNLVINEEGLTQAEEANAAVSRLAFKLQQAFVQARVDFLGKPFQLALEEFVDCTMRAYALGVDLLTLQLQLLLAERACYGGNLSEDVEEMVSQEGRVRAMWIRLAYVTFNHAAEVKAAKAGTYSADDIRIDPAEDLDGQGQFVKAVIQMHLEQGLTLDRLRLQQAYGEKTDSPAIEALKQSHYLILMALAKALGEY